MQPIPCVCMQGGASSVTACSIHKVTLVVCQCTVDALSIMYVPPWFRVLRPAAAWTIMLLVIYYRSESLSAKSLLAFIDIPCP